MPKFEGKKSAEVNVVPSEHAHRHPPDDEEVREQKRAAQGMRRERRRQTVSSRRVLQEKSPANPRG